MGQVISFEHAANRLRRTGCQVKSAWTMKLINRLNNRNYFKAKVEEDKGDIEEIRKPEPQNWGEAKKLYMSPNWAGIAIDNSKHKVNTDGKIPVWTNPTNQPK